MPITRHDPVSNLPPREGIPHVRALVVRGANRSVQIEQRDPAPSLGRTAFNSPSGTSSSVAALSPVSVAVSMKCLLKLDCDKRARVG